MAQAAHAQKIRDAQEKAVADGQAAEAERARRRASDLADELRSLTKASKRQRLDILRSCHKHGFSCPGGDRSAGLRIIKASVVDAAERRGLEAEWDRLEETEPADPPSSDDLAELAVGLQRWKRETELHNLVVNLRGLTEAQRLQLMTSCYMDESRCPGGESREDSVKLLLLAAVDEAERQRLVGAVQALDVATGADQQ